MSEINLMLKEITNKVNLETNLSKYSNYMMSQYNSLSYTKVALNYYTLADMVSEKKDISSKLVNLVERLNVIIEKYVINQSVEDIEDGVMAIDSIRNEIMNIMNIVTSYADHFNLYEYILNRVEYRFVEDDYDDTYYKTDFGKDIMNYIVSERENNTINLKISEIVGQLPVRMTKNKFLELVSNTFTLYNGATNKSVDDFIYMLRTSSTISKPDGFETEFEEFYTIIKEFEQVDFKNIDKDTYDRCHDLLMIAAEKVYVLSDVFMLLEEVVNDVYVIILSNPYAMCDVEKNNATRNILKYAYSQYNGIKCDINDDNIDESFAKIEGEQERLSEIIMACEYVIDDVLNNSMDICQSLVLDKIYKTLGLIIKLQSSSIFIELNEEEVDSQIITEEDLETKKLNLLNELNVLFKDNSQLFNRAVMAVILSSLPVFFNSLQEVTDYVNNSLFACSDVAEKRAVEEVIRNIMFE